MLNLLVVAAQTVYTEDIKQISRIQLSNHFLILRSIEVFSGKLIHIDVLCCNIHFVQCYHLSIFVLINARYPYVSINLVFHNASSFPH
jgi:hypothetical protein